MEILVTKDPIYMKNFARYVDKSLPWTFSGFSDVKDEAASVAGEIGTEAAKAAGNEVEKQPVKDENNKIIKSLWISGLSSVTRAVDLKAIFSKYGKVMICNDIII